jgi:hypothetical protein
MAMCAVTPRVIQRRRKLCRRAQGRERASHVRGRAAQGTAGLSRRRTEMPPRRVPRMWPVADRRIEQPRPAARQVERFRRRRMCGGAGGIPTRASHHRDCGHRRRRSAHLAPDQRVSRCCRCCLRERLHRADAPVHDRPSRPPGTGPPPALPPTARPIHRLPRPTRNTRARQRENSPIADQDHRDGSHPAPAYRLADTTGRSAVASLFLVARNTVPVRIGLPVPIELDCALHLISGTRAVRRRR